MRRSWVRSSKLTAHEVALLKAELLKPHSVTTIARKYDIDPMSVYRIKWRRTWPNVNPYEPPQEAVPVDQVTERLRVGWTFVASLPDGTVVLQRPKKEKEEGDATQALR